MGRSRRRSGGRAPSSDDDAPNTQRRRGGAKRPPASASRSVRSADYVGIEDLALGDAQSKRDNDGEETKTTNSSESPYSCAEVLNEFTHTEELRPKKKQASGVERARKVRPPNQSSKQSTGRRSSSNSSEATGGTQSESATGTGGSRTSGSDKDESTSPGTSSWSPSVTAGTGASGTAAPSPSDEDVERNAVDKRSPKRRENVRRIVGPSPNMLMLIVVIVGVLLIIANATALIVVANQ